MRPHVAQDLTTAASRRYGEPGQERERFTEKCSPEAEPPRHPQYEADAHLEKAPRHQDRQQHSRRRSRLRRRKRETERQRPGHDRRKGEQVEEVVRQHAQ